MHVVHVVDERKKKKVQSSLLNFTKPIIKSSDNLPVFQTPSGETVPVANFKKIKVNHYSAVCEKLNVTSTSKVGRPSDAVKNARALAREIAIEVDRSNHDIDSVMNSIKFEEKVKASKRKLMKDHDNDDEVMDSTDDPDDPDRDDEIVQLKEKVKRTQSVYGNLMEKSLVHLWAKDGSHAGNDLLTYYYLSFID